MKNYYLKSGQVGIIAVLVGIVIFTLGMSVAARVTTDVRLSARSEEGARTNAAAEASMEIAMAMSLEELAEVAKGTPIPTWSDTDLVRSRLEVVAYPDPTHVSGAEYVYELGPMMEGDFRTVWLVHLAEEPDMDPFKADDYLESFQIVWSGANTKVEVALYYHSESSGEQVSLWRNLVVKDNFFDIDPAIDTKKPSNFNSTNPLDQFYLVRIKMVEGDAVDGVFVLPDKDTGIFPIQEFSIVADGETIDGQVRRRTTGRRKVGEIPLFFDYVLASGNGDLVK